MLLLENQLNIKAKVDKETILDTQKIILYSIACLKFENKEIIRTKKLLRQIRHKWTHYLYKMNLNLSTTLENNQVNIKLLHQLNNELNRYIKDTYGSFKNFTEAEELINVELLKTTYTNLYNSIYNHLLMLDHASR